MLKTAYPLSYMISSNRFCKLVSSWFKLSTDELRLDSLGFSKELISVGCFVRRSDSGIDRSDVGRMICLLEYYL